MVTGGGAFRRQLGYENAGLMSEVSTLTRGDTRQLASSLFLSHVRMQGCVVTQSCLTLCDPMDCSLRGSSVHEIFQARELE